LVLHYLNDILCKNYNYMFVFAKVIPKTLLVPFFSGHGVVMDLWCSPGMHTIQFFTSRFYKSRYRDESVLRYLPSSSQCWSVYCHSSGLFA